MLSARIPREKSFGRGSEIQNYIQRPRSRRQYRGAVTCTRPAVDWSAAQSKKKMACKKKCVGGGGGGPLDRARGWRLESSSEYVEEGGAGRQKERGQPETKGVKGREWAKMADACDSRQRVFVLECRPLVIPGTRWEGGGGGGR